MSAKEMLAEIKQRGLIKAGNIQDELNALAVSQEEEIISLNHQLSAKTISEQNIINAFGISGEGAHSKLVIEYVHGLVAENVAVKKYAKIDDYDKCDNCGFESYVMPIETPNTDTFTAELSAQGVGEFAADMWKRGNELVAEGGQQRLVVQVRLAAKLADTYVDNLRAGRKV